MATITLEKPVTQEQTQQSRQSALYTRFFHSDPEQAAEAVRSIMGQPQTTAAPSAVREENSNTYYTSAMGQRTLYADYDVMVHPVMEAAPTEVREETEDSVPTSQTMQHLYGASQTEEAEVQTEERQQTEEQIGFRPVAWEQMREQPHSTELTEEDADPQGRIGFFASLSTSTKIVLAVVTVLTILLFAVLIINSGIISSLDVQIASRQSELSGLIAQSDELLGRIKQVTDPTYVDEYAEYVLNMVRP